MLGIRQKLSLGFGALLLILLVIGTESIVLLTGLGESIDVILRENYRSVIACQEMKESLERMHGAVLFSLLGYENEGAEQIAQNDRKFESALQAELDNITLPGELEKATAVQNLFREYRSALAQVQDKSQPLETRRATYFRQVLPLFHQAKDTADDILRMNQDNMSEANDRARRTASSARHRMIILLVMGAAVAGGFVTFTGRWILRPITRLTESAEEIGKGNLALVVAVDSTDEIGRLSQAFNSMAESLREFRRSDRSRLLRVQRSTEDVFRHLPDAVAVVNLNGTVEVATEIAKRVFALGQGSPIDSASVELIGSLFRQAVRTGRTSVSENRNVLIQRFIDGEERYFRPKAVPILDSEKRIAGVIVVIEDLTVQRRGEELKRGVIATVSHQLKTPLTSIRMAIHMLLDDRVGYLNEKQAELLVSAREEGERLHSIIEQLLQISRIDSGKLEMHTRDVTPHELVFEAVEPFRRAAQDSGITLETDLPDDLPPVLADPAMMHHVFANLLSNALKYTDPGGRLTVSARAKGDLVWFSVSDTGRGIPRRYLERILEQFFRVPGQESGTGVGLGLAIVRQIVDAHGGMVTVDSVEREGSTFTLSLKRARVSGREVEEV